MNVNPTKHFSVNEILRSETALSLGIDNIPKDEAVIRNLNNTLLQLEQLRELYGKPIVITSGYRCPELNKAVGGKANSQHLRGEAVDLKWDTNLVNFIQEKYHFDQLIREKNKSTKWIHISWKIDESLERGQVISLSV